MNKCIFKGRLGADPDVRTIPSGTMVVNFSIAVDRTYKNKDGNRDTDWVPCVAWGPRAEIINKYFHKGSNILVETELQVTKYEDKDGNKRTKYEFNVLGIDFVDPGSGSPDSQTNQSTQSERIPLPEINENEMEDAEDDELPF